MLDGPVLPWQPPQIVQAHHKKARGVDGLAGADHIVPPAGGFIVRVMAAGNMMVARQRMTDQDGVAGVGVQLAIGFKHQLIVLKRGAAGQGQRRVEEGGLRRDKADGMRVWGHLAYQVWLGSRETSQLNSTSGAMAQANGIFLSMACRWRGVRAAPSCPAQSACP